MARVQYDSENARSYMRVTGSERRDHGRASFVIECPFCLTRSRAYKWSIAGGGKKCENKDCGAMHTSSGLTRPRMR